MEAGHFRMYSQNDEERYILEAVDVYPKGRLSIPAPGVFLDIGAYDGKTFSNTAALVARGWSGVLVEPSMHAFHALRQRYAGNPRLTLVHAAVGMESRIVKFWESRDAVSTTSEKHRELWKDAGAYEEPYYIAQIGLGHLLDNPHLHNIDVLSIDTEGTSGSLFLEWPSAGPWPKVVIVEYDLSEEPLTAHANQNGYKLAYKSNENLVFVHESSRPRAQVSNG